MSEERLQKIHAHYARLTVEGNFNVTFEQFVKLVEIGRWFEAMESGRLPLVHKGRLEEMKL